MGYVGRGIAPLESIKFVRGEGKYVDDIESGVVHLGVVRSPYAHALIEGIDASDAIKRALLVLLPGEIEKELPHPRVPADTYGDARIVEMPILAGRKVNFVGQPVVGVVGRDRYEVEDLKELVSVDYSPLEAVIDPEEAIKSSAPLIHDELGSNVSLRTVIAGGDVDEAFRRAGVVVEDELYVHRVVPNPIEPRGFMATFKDDRLAVRASTQSVFRMRTELARIFGLPPENVRVEMPDVGGAFGSKTPVYPEYVLACYASRVLGRTVKWIEARREHLVATHQGRDVKARIRVAASRSGEVLGLQARVLADIGAYNFFVNSWYGCFVAQQLTGPYRIGAASVEVLSVFTNKTPTGPYRGFGRPEAAFFYERAMDLLSDELRLDPAELRMRNLVRPDQMPHMTVLGLRLDKNDYPSILRTALESFKYKETREWVRREREAGRLIGLGLAVYIEISRTSWGEGALLRLREDGKIELFTGAGPHGQGIKTILAQLVADELCMDIRHIEPQPADSAALPRGVGTFASRSATIAGAAALEAARELKQILLRAASDVLGVPPVGLVIEDGIVSVRGDPRRSVSLSEVAKKRGPIEVYKFVSGDDVVSFGSHMAIVEVDRETGRVEVLRYMAVDDAGRVINPLLIEGQLIGGIMQGAGQLLYEGAPYSPEGQPMIGGIGDAGVPSSAESLNEIDSVVTEHPSSFTHGARGIGEAGTIGSLPTLTRAVEDAVGKRLRTTRINLEDLWRVLRAP